MQVMVTGASGYIGSALSHALADRGFTVHALVRSINAAKKLKHPFIRVFEGDILDRQSISKAMSGCDQVYHTAGLVKICAYDPSQFYLHNVTGTENVLLESLHHRVRKFLYTSSCGVWGPTGDHIFNEKYPRIAGYDNDYEISKMLAEKCVAQYRRKGLHTVIVNPTKVYGFGTNKEEAVHYNGQLKKWVSARLILLPWQTRAETNFAFIDDVVEGHILAMEKGLNGERYILGGHNLSIRELYASVAAHCDHPRVVIRIPGWILKLWGIYELMRSMIKRKDPRITPALIPRLTQNAKYSSEAAVQQLGYTITPFTESLKKTINHVKHCRRIRE